MNEAQNTTVVAWSLIFHNKWTILVSESDLDLPHPLFASFVTLIRICVFIIGIVGNVITCTVIIRNKCMHTPKNCYLLNLAISDLILLTVGVPYEIYIDWRPSKFCFGKAGCLLYSWLLETSINVSILTIAGFTTERYLGVCHPFTAYVMQQLSRVLKLIVVIWIIAASCSFIVAMQIQFVTAEDIAICSKKFLFRMPYTLEITTIIIFIIPVIIITISYSLITITLIKSFKIKKSSNDTTKEFLKISLLVVVAFFICWSPFYIERMIIVFGEDLTFKVSHGDREILNLFMSYSACLLFQLSAAINPIIYNITSKQFRATVKQMLFGKKSGLSVAYCRT